MNKLVGMLAFGALLAFAGQAQAQVRVQMAANRTDVAVNDNVVVQITVQTRGGQPEIEIPEFDGFEVVQRSEQHPMSFSMGFGQAQPQVTASANYTFVLQPAAAGQFKILPVRVTLDNKVYASQPLLITVRGANGQAPPPAQPQAADPQAADPQAAPAPPTAAAQNGDAYQVDPDAFLRTVVDKTSPYLGEQVTVTVFLYARRNLQQMPAVRAEPGTDGFWVHDVLSAGQQPETSRAAVNGRAYWVYVLRRFAAFPLRTGELTIGPMSLTISHESIFDMLDPGHAQPNLDRTGVPLLLHVKPLPDAGKPSEDVNVGKFQIAAQLDRAQVATGDAVTLSATVHGEGNIASVRVPNPVVAGVDVLQPETHELVEVQEDVVTGTRTFSWLIVPRAPGTYTIPALAFDAFDPKTGAYQHVASAPLTLVAAGNAKPALAVQAPAAANNANGATPTAADDSHVKQEALPPLHTRSALARHAASLADQPFYGLALLLGPLMWLGSVLVPALRNKLRNREGSEGRERMRKAQERLQEAERALQANDARRFHAELANALTQLVQARLDENISGLTRHQARAALANRGLPQAAASELLDVLERCDVARFSPAGSDAAAMRDELKRAQTCFSTLTAFNAGGAA